MNQDSLQIRIIMKKIVAALSVLSIFISIELIAEQRWCANVRPQAGWQVYDLKSSNVGQGVVHFSWQIRRKGSSGVGSMNCGQNQSNKITSTNSIGVCYPC